MSTTYKPMYVFTLRDGAVRAWTVAQLDGKIVFVSTPFEAAKRQVEKGEAEEAPSIVMNTAAYGRQVPLNTVMTEDSAAGCGCGGKAKAEVDVAVVGTQKTEVAFAGRGRLVGAGESRVSEALFAVAEGPANHVACYGRGCEGVAGTPNALIFDTYSPKEGGGYTVSNSVETALPQKLVTQYASRSPSCLPWVRVERDPERFRGCLEKARAMGPMKDSGNVVKLAGDFLMKQDQEVFLVILLDVQLQIRGISEVARGARDHVDVPVPDVLRVAIVDGSSGIIVVHNHPSGIARPSESDEELTKTLQDACRQVHMELIDHVIIAGDKSYSFAKHKNILKRAKT
jgi:RadC-like JAB domain